MMCFENLLGHFIRISSTYAYTYVDVSSEQKAFHYLKCVREVPIIDTKMVLKIRSRNKLYQNDDDDDSERFLL